MHAGNSKNTNTIDIQHVSTQITHSEKVSLAFFPRLEEKKEMQQRKIFEFTTLKCQQRNQWHWLAVVDSVSVYKSG